MSGTWNAPVSKYTTPHNVTPAVLDFANKEIPTLKRTFDFQRSLAKWELAIVELYSQSTALIDQGKRK